MRIFGPKMTSRRKRHKPREQQRFFRWRVLILRLWEEVLGAEGIMRYLDFVKALRARGLEVVYCGCKGGGGCSRVGGGGGCLMEASPFEIRHPQFCNLIN